MGDIDDYYRGRVNLERTTVNHAINKAYISIAERFGRDSVESKAATYALEFVERNIWNERHDIDEKFPELRKAK